MSSDMTPGDRRELRAIVKKQFQVLRAEVKRRAQEMRAEVEKDLLNRYREQDNTATQTARELDLLFADYQRQVQGVAKQLMTARPELTVEITTNYRTGGLGIRVDDPTRRQLRDAAIAAIPTKIADAETELDQQELQLLRELTVGALTTEEARQFLDRIPTVGALVPAARLPELTTGPQETA